MKKYLVILIVILLFGKVAAQSIPHTHQPHGHTSMAETNVQHLGDSVIVSENEIVIDTIPVSKTKLVLSKELIAKFGKTDVIDNYLQYNKNSPETSYIFSLTHGMYAGQYILFTKNNVVSYKEKRIPSAVPMAGLFIGIFIGFLFGFISADEIKKSILLIVLGILMAVIIPSGMLDYDIHVFDQAVIPIGSYILSSFFGLWLGFKRAAKKKNSNSRIGGDETIFA